ncbi:MAG: DUF5671 domain-containing protein [Chloroflexota bacterium]
MSTTRRVFLYVLAFITLGIFAAGAGQLLSLAFDITIRGSTVAVGGQAFNQQQLSLGLAMLVIGGPLWFLFWGAIRRRVLTNKEEIGAVMRKFYLNLILLVTAFTWLSSTSNFLMWLMAGVPVARFSSGGLAAVIVTGIIWYYHFRVSETEGHPSPAARTLRRWYVYILSARGLVWLASGPVIMVYTTVSNLPVWGGALVGGRFWNDSVQGAIAWIVLGGVTWYFHWFRMARGDFESQLRQVYFYLFAILGGAIATLVALTVTFYLAFAWAFGGATTSRHFMPLGWSVPLILIGASIWRYHQWRVQEEATQVYERQFSAERVHFYLMSFLGLGAIVSGFIILFGIFLDLIINATTPPVAITAGWWRNQLSLCLALLIVGTPMWLRYWGMALRRAEAGGATEWRARSRRIFLYAMVGISIVTLAADLVNIVYRLLNGILLGNLGIGFLRTTRWSLQTVIVAAVVLWYHWQVARTDQKRGAEGEALYKSVVLLAGSGALELVPRIEKALGYKIRIMTLLGAPGEKTPVLSDEEVSRLVSEVQQAPSTEIMLVTLEGKIAVLPYQNK